MKTTNTSECVSIITTLEQARAIFPTATENWLKRFAIGMKEQDCREYAERHCKTFGSLWDSGSKANKSTTSEEQKAQSLRQIIASLRGLLEIELQDYTSLSEEMAKNQALATKDERKSAGFIRIYFDLFESEERVKKLRNAITTLM